MTTRSPAHALAAQDVSRPAAALAVQLSGTWKLPLNRAITLQPSEDGEIRVAHGRIWATYDGPHRGAPNDFGDHAVGVGERLRLRAGQRLVIQSWDQDAPAYFVWDRVLPQVQPAREFSFAPVLQPLADLRLAVALAGRASVRLALGLAGLVRGLLVPRPARHCV